MRRFLGLAPVLLLAAACDGSTARVGQTLDAARGAAERIAAASETANDRREQKIYATAQEMQEQAQIRSGVVAATDQPRYQIRLDGNEWTVFDTANNRPAKVGSKIQQGLSHEAAEAAFMSLIQQDQNDTNMKSSSQNPVAPLRF